MATRDLPNSFKELSTGWIDNLENEVTLNRKTKSQIEEEEQEDAVKKVQFKNLWPAFCSGAGLFSDGYVNNSISAVTTCLSRIYGEAYTNSNAISNVSAIAFVGIVVGQLSFGYISDHIARKGGMLAATVLLIFFTILCACGTWGANGSAEGLFAALTTFRFFLGVALGAEYPTSSVIASEFAHMLPSGHRNRYFIWFTNTMIDFGFVVAAFVPLVLLWIFGDHNLEPVWRLTLGLGVVPPLFLFFFRLKMSDSESFKKTNIKKAKKVPYWSIYKFYWFRLFIVSMVWAIYDFSAYSFGIYSSYIFTQIVPTKADGLPDLYKSFGWNVVFNLFYLPGSFLGALVADYIGPRLTIVIGVTLQAIIGFIMASCYDSLSQHIAAFAVVYGIFTTLGEFSIGDNIGLLAAKTSATAIRGQYYSISAAAGKISAFIAVYIFPVIIRNTDGIKAPFYISSSLCLLAAVLTLFLCPPVGQDVVEKEDELFLNYLESTGYDISQLGDVSEADSSESVESEVGVVKTERASVKVEAEKNIDT